MRYNVYRIENEISVFFILTLYRFCKCYLCRTIYLMPLRGWYSFTLNWESYQRHQHSCSSNNHLPSPTSHFTLHFCRIYHLCLISCIFFVCVKHLLDWSFLGDKNYCLIILSSLKINLAYSLLVNSCWIKLICFCPTKLDWQLLDIHKITWTVRSNQIQNGISSRICGKAWDHWDD